MSLFKFYVTVALFTYSYTATASQTNKNTILLLEKLEYISEEYIHEKSESNQYYDPGIVNADIKILLEEIWEVLGVSKKKVISLPWARAYQTALTKDNVVLFSMARTKERENLFKWVCPITSAKYSLIAPIKNRIKIKSIKDLKTLKIGVVREDVSAQLIKKLMIDNQVYNEENIHANKSSYALIKMLAIGRLDLIGYTPSLVNELLINNQMSIDDFEEVLVIGKKEVCFAFSNTVDTKVIELFREALKKVLKLPQYAHFG